MEPLDKPPEQIDPQPTDWRILQLDRDVPKSLIKKIKESLVGTPGLDACYLFLISKPGQDPEPAIGFYYPKPVPQEEFETISHNVLDVCLEEMQNAGLFLEAVLIGPERKDEVTLSGRLIYKGKKASRSLSDIGTFLVLGGILIGIIIGGIFLWKQYSKPKPEPLPPPPPPVQVPEQTEGPREIVEAEPNTFTNIDPAEDEALNATKDCKNITTIIEGTTIREVCND